MKLNCKIYFIVVALLVFFVNDAVASTQLQTSSFRAIEKYALQQGNKYGNSNVLLAFDVDNTLLTRNQLLGSQAWWDWQEDLLRNHPNSPLLIEKTQKAMLRALKVIAGLNYMNLTEPSIPQVLSRLQALGFKTIVLTGRCPGYYAITERDLSHVGLSFKPYAINPVSGFAQSYYVPAASKRVKVSYTDGMIFVCDLNKGKVLLDLLQRTNSDVKAIIFVDDKAFNIRDVANAFATSAVDVTTFRYGREDAKAARFCAAAKEKSTEQWRKLKQKMASTCKKLGL